MDLATLGVLGALAGVGTVLVAPQFRGPATQSSVPISEDFQANHRDFDEVGLSYGAQRTGYLNMTNLNEAWKPRTAPRQRSTNNISDVYRSEADSAAYLAQYAPPFYFQTQGEMPLSTPVQSNPSVEVPSCTSSIRGDPSNSLLFYPRVYIDYCHDPQNPHRFTYEYGTMNSSGFPSETEVPFVPMEGALNFNYNPYGPGGDLQRLYNREARQATRRHWVDRAKLLQPPPTNYTSARYYQR